MRCACILCTALYTLAHDDDSIGFRALRIGDARAGEGNCLSRLLQMAADGRARAARNLIKCDSRVYHVGYAEWILCISTVRYKEALVRCWL